MVVDVGVEDVAEVVACRAEAAITERDQALAIVSFALSTTTTSTLDALQRINPISTHL